MELHQNRVTLVSPVPTVATSLAKVDTIKKCCAILCIHMCPELQADSPRRSRIERLKAVDEPQYNSIGNGQGNSGRIVNTEAWSRSKLSRTSDGQADEIGGPIVHGRLRAGRPAGHNLQPESRYGQHRPAAVSLVHGQARFSAPLRTRLEGQYKSLKWIPRRHNWANHF
ncbi:hypothetical protein pipiens_009267 [Culex pipiens pipiens]|uniref:Uncharacterized protein n=1 Tax=Culex pipiens pipiens TaxID=38569 RepID=A0ABD1DEE1_CULPP